MSCYHNLPLVVLVVISVILCLMHHPINFGFLSQSVYFHALSPRVASYSNLVAVLVLVLVPACCFHVLRADSIAVVTAVTPSARWAWSVLLSAVGYALVFLGPFPGCFFSFYFKMSL